MIKFKVLGMHCEDMRFRLNVVKAEPQTKFEIKPEFNRQLKKVKELPKRRIIEMTVKMISTEENPKPFDLAIRMVAAFELEEEIWLAEDEKEFVTAATRATFPYLRSAITNLTASAMINPLILPPLDGGTLFPDELPKAE
ncbi:MAG: protein-export chaperone SecB [Clostridia bacterium]|nr:protein-export chaperone SecB [Clostridia bacterium]